jgi:hypothetical protein
MSKDFLNVERITAIKSYDNQNTIIVYMQTYSLEFYLDQNNRSQLKLLIQHLNIAPSEIYVSYGNLYFIFYDLEICFELLCADGKDLKIKKYPNKEPLNELIRKI